MLTKFYPFYSNVGQIYILYLEGNRYFYIYTKPLVLMGLPVSIICCEKNDSYN